MLTLRHALVRQHYGRAVKIMMKQSEDKPTKELDGRMVEVSQLMLQSLESVSYTRLFVVLVTSAMDWCVLVHVCLLCLCLIINMKTLNIFLCCTYGPFIFMICHRHYVFNLSVHLCMRAYILACLGEGILRPACHRLLVSLAE